MNERTKGWMLFFSMVLIVSVIYSKYVLSLSMFGLLLIAILHSKGSFKFWEDRSLLYISLFFFLFLISGVNSENYSDWMHHLKMRLPFLALPLIFYKLPSWSRSEMVAIHTFLMLVLSISSIPIAFELLINFDFVHKNIAQGIPLETPVNHVKYSIFIAYAVVSGLVIYFKGEPYKYAWEKPLTLGMVIYLTFFLHALAVRSGIVVFYISLLIIGMYYAYQSRSLKILVVATLMITVLPVLTFIFIPSLNKRIHYMVYDVKEYLKNGGDNYSDSDRINSLIIGAFIFKDYPIVGAGIGDIKDECTTRYDKKFGHEKKVLYPHNQYLFIAASTGILGLIIFLIALFGPGVAMRGSANPFLMVLIIIYASGFIVDNLLERSASAAFFAFFMVSAIRTRADYSNQ